MSYFIEQIPFGPYNPIHCKYICPLYHVLDDGWVDEMGYQHGIQYKGGSQDNKTKNEALDSGQRVRDTTLLP